MTSRKCGTCYFFQEAGFAGSGWCRNDLFRKSDDVKTMVRRNELACRDGWNKSLWTDPRDAARTGAALQPITTQVERPATEGEIGFMVNSRDAQPNRRPSDQGDDATGGEDVVVGQITVTPAGQTGRRRLVDQVPFGIQDGDRPFGDDDREAAERTAPVVGLAATSPESEPAATQPDEQELAFREETRRAIREARERRRQRMIGQPGHSGPAPRDRGSSHPAPAPVAASPRQAKSRPRAGTSPDNVRPPEGEPVFDNRAMGHLADADEPFAVESADQDSAMPARRRAPVPGPVPTRELQPANRRGSGGAARSGAGLPSLDVPSAASQPGRRPVLPDLPDDFFTQGVLDAARASLRDDDQQPERAPRGGMPRGGFVSKPVMTAPGQQRAGMGRPDADIPDTTTGPESAPGGSRPRPAVPRLNGGASRPAPTQEPGLPTVAEANRVGEPARRQGARPPLFQRASAPSAATPPSGSAGMGRPHMQSAQPPVSRADHYPVGDRAPRQQPESRGERTWAGEPEDVVLGMEPDATMPPGRLRPRAEDFGQYGGWFELESVEPRVAPELPRRCETCRDFRPSENGERGWCANRDAFTHRRMVNASDLPCISSFGCWWLPFDDVWLAEANIREHRQPTPLLDRMFPEESDDILWERQQRRS